MPSNAFPGPSVDASRKPRRGCRPAPEPRPRRRGKAKGFTLDYGYYLNKRWQFDVRYSRDNLLYETANTKYWTSADERELEYVTLGVNYYFAPKTRLTFNYEFRTATAPNPAPTAAATNNANEITGSVGDRFGLRLTHSF